MTQTLGAGPIGVHDLRESYLLSFPNIKIKVHHVIQSLISFQRNIQERDGGRESPRLTPESDLSSEAAVVGSAVAARVQELSEEDMKKKSIAIIEEYLIIKNMSVCLRDHCPF